MYASEQTALMHGRRIGVSDIGIFNFAAFGGMLIRRSKALIFRRGDFMKTVQVNLSSYVSIAVLLSLGACASMSEQEKGTAIGAGVGAVGGAVLGGGTLGTLGGAAVGGVIGHEVTKPKKDCPINQSC
jgi:osmotically inducible lipoprotein OsmB